jgi:hypothetical protein
MDPEGTYIKYIESLQKFRYENIELNSDNLNILMRFSISKYTSSYQLMKFLESRGRIISYKNTRKKVIKYQSLGLIEVSKRIRKHKTIYYKLTEYGIFYLYYKRQIWMSLKDILENYGNFPIFHLLLYPILAREKLSQIRYGYLEFNKYLANCCKKIADILSQASKKTRDSDLETPIFFWDDIPDSDVKEDLLFYLLTSFGFEWLESGCLVQKLDDKTIRINKGRKILFMKFDDAKLKVNLVFRKKLLRQFSVKPFEFDKRKTLVYDTAPRRTWKEILQANFPSNSLFDFHEQIESLSFSLLDIYQNPSDHFNYDRREMFHDLKIFKNDSRFLNLLDLVSKKYILFYKDFKNNLEAIDSQ